MYHRVAMQNVIMDGHEYFHKNVLSIIIISYTRIDYNVMSNAILLITNGGGTLAHLTIRLQALEEGCYSHLVVPTHNSELCDNSQTQI